MGAGERGVGLGSAPLCQEKVAELGEQRGVLREDGEAGLGRAQREIRAAGAGQGE